jgi:hypothetical protein
LTFSGFGKPARQIHSSPQPTTAADIATAAVELFTAGLENVDLFTHLIM